jgi:hypothetical protein
MKYDAQISQISPQITSAQNILIAIPTEITADRLASGLALYLSLKQAGKNVSIVTDGVLTVGFTHLFGIGDVKNQIPQTNSGNYTVTLGGVVDSSGHIPSLQNLDWSPSGQTKSDLKLVFHVVPGQKFEPTFITPGFEGGNFDLIITIGANTWLALGSIYASNSQIFSSTKILNIDNQANNTQFGSMNLVGNVSLSEIIGLILPILGLPLEGDIASNIIAGIFSATNNLQIGSAETFEVMAALLKAGGQKPSLLPNTAPISEQNSAPVAATPVWVAEPSQSVTPTQGFDISPFLNPQNFSVSTSPDASNQPVSSPQPDAVLPAAEEPVPQQMSYEEVPVGEQVQTVLPEADWLTPKIFKSSKIG